ncbi:MAG: SBBP repeat-containing protein, partial [Promethearchaeota archaeon]
MPFNKIKFKNKSSQIIILICLFIITFPAVFLNLNLISSPNPNNDDSRSYYSDEIIPLTNDDQIINITSPKEGIYTTKGYYPATFGFERDVDGKIPSGWYSPHKRDEDGMVFPEYEGHKKVLKIVHKTNRYGELYHTVGSKQMSGTIEFWMLNTVEDKYASVTLYDKDESNLLLQVAFYRDSYITYRSGKSWENATKYSSNTWYHVKIQFNCYTNRYTLKINDNLIASDISFYEDNAGKGFQRIILYADFFASDFDAYFDAFGFSWDAPNYNIGDNLKEGLLIDFKTTIGLNWIGYSLDGQATKRIYGKTVIPKPKDGLHTIQIIGYDSSGTEYKSEKRYFTITPETKIDQYSLFKTSLGDILVEKDFFKEWERTFGVNSKRDEVIDMAIDSFGNIYVVGYTNSDSSNEFSDIVIIKYGRDSTRIWEVFWDGPYNRDDKANAIAIDSSNNIFIAGYTEVVKGTKINKDVIVIKFDSDGNHIRERTWGDDYNESANALNIDSSDNVIITGYKNQIGPAGLNKDILLLKYQNNLEGSPVEKYWGGSDSDEAFDVSTDHYDNIYITGYTERSGFGKDIVLLKYSESIGNPLFIKYWG